MKLRIAWVVAGCLSLCSAVSGWAQQTSVSGANVVVPTLVNFSGLLTNGDGKALTGIVGVSFYLYKDQEGGAPLWMETQNVQPDRTGHYTVALGATTSQGLPMELFASGEARWLGVQPQGQVEQPRVMLLSVPYAMKAVDAETVGGLPPSAFVRATPGAATSGNGSSAPTGNAGTAGISVGRPNVSAKTASPAIQTQSYVAKFINGTGGLGNSLIFDNGTNVGVATTAPSFPLDVAGIFNAQKDIQGLGDLRVDFKGLNKSTLSPGIRFGSGNVGEGIASARGGTTNLYGIDLYTRFLSRVSITNGGSVGIGTRAPSDALDVVGSAHIDFSDQNIGSSTPNLAFGDSGSGEGISSTRSAGTINKWGLDFWTNHQRHVSITNAGNVGIGTATPSANLEVNGTAKFDGMVNLAGGVTGNLNVTGSEILLGGGVFASAVGKGNTFLGFAGNSTTTGIYNTASGYLALQDNTTGIDNTADGVAALASNTMGTGNTASGESALTDNTTGSYNTADGFQALGFNTAGSNNTASGYNALNNNLAGANTASGVSALSLDTTGSYNTASGYQSGSTLDSTYITGSNNTFLGINSAISTGSLSNATAIGANTEVSASNSMVLGSIKDMNGATANTNVGIGTTAPSNVFTIGQNAGHAIADGWDTYSSRRWKTNIQTLRGALAKVEQLRGVSYDLRVNGKHEVGLIAEEVGAVVPEVVSYEENGKDARAWTTADWRRC